MTMESHWQHWLWLISTLVASATFLAIRPRPPFGNRWITSAAALTVAAATVEIMAVALGWGSTRPIPDLASVALLAALAFGVVTDRRMPRGAEGPRRVERSPIEKSEITSSPDRLDLVHLSFERMGEAVAISDHEGKIVFANDPWALMHGHRAADIMGHRWSLFHTPDQLERQFRPLKRQAEAAGSHEGMIERRRRDGSTVSTWTQLIRLIDAGGDRTVGWLAVARESTAAPDEGTQLAYLAREVSHTFNNLLSAIVGTTGLALEKLPTGSELKEDLEEIEAAAMRAAELTGKLQAAARKMAPDDRPPTLAQRRSRSVHGGGAHGG